MAWAKFDDRWATHPKLLAAGLEAKGLDASGICYCAGQETDGFVPDTALVILCAGHRNPRKVADRLVDVGRWTRDDERKGYLIHDFERYNFTRAEGEAKRKRDADRKAAARAKQGRDAQGRITSGQTGEDVRADTDDCPDGFPEESEWIPTPVPPVPTRPDPTPGLHTSSSEHQSVGRHPDDDDEKSPTRRAVERIADKRIAATMASGKAISNPGGYRASVLKSVDVELGDDIDRMVAEGYAVEAIVEKLLPAVVAPKPYPKAEDYRPAFNDDDLIESEHGLTVLMPRRTG